MTADHPDVGATELLELLACWKNVVSPSSIWVMVKDAVAIMQTLP